MSVTQIAFGHMPNAFGQKGDVGGVFHDPKQGTLLLKLDAGLGNDDSRGILVRCTKWSANGWCDQ